MRWRRPSISFLMDPADDRTFVGSRDAAGTCARRNRVDGAVLCRHHVGRVSSGTTTRQRTLLEAPVVRRAPVPAHARRLTPPGPIRPRRRGAVAADRSWSNGHDTGLRSRGRRFDSCRADARSSQGRTDRHAHTARPSAHQLGVGARGEHPRAGRADRAMPFVFPHLALMPDAHLGKGATVGSVIPTVRAIIPAAVGVDIGCGMIAVRTQFIARRPRRPRPARTAAWRSSRRAALGGRHNRTLTETAQSRDRPSSSSGARSTTTSTPATGGCSWARSARATTSSRSPSTSRTGSGCSCTPARAASATRSRSTTSPSRKDSCERLVDRAAGPRPRLPRRGHRRVLGLHPRPALGAALRPAQPRGDDGPRRGCLSGGSAAVVESTSASTATTTSPQQEEHFGERRVGVAQGRHRGAGGQPGLIPGSMGTASYVVAGKGTRCR